MILDVSHPRIANVPKEVLKSRIAKDFKVKDNNCVSLFGFKTAFGGKKSTGFCLIYQNMEAMKKFERESQEGSSKISATRPLSPQHDPPSLLSHLETTVFKFFSKSLVSRRTKIFEALCNWNEI